VPARLPKSSNSPKLVDSVNRLSATVSCPRPHSPSRPRRNSCPSNSTSNSTSASKYFFCVCARAPARAPRPNRSRTRGRTRAHGPPTRLRLGTPQGLGRRGDPYDLLPRRLHRARSPAAEHHAAHHAPRRPTSRRGVARHDAPNRTPARTMPPIAAPRRPNSHRGVARRDAPPAHRHRVANHALTMGPAATHHPRAHTPPPVPVARRAPPRGAPTREFSPEQDGA
jgi:hypothetical protein